MSADDTEDDLSDVIPMTFAHEDTKVVATTIIEALEWLKERVNSPSAMIVALVDDDEVFLNWFGDYETIDHLRERIAREQVLEAMEDAFE